MNPDERFKDKLLERLSRLGEYGWHVRTSLLAFDYAVVAEQRGNHPAPCRTFSIFILQRG